jgi:hypothetical protein
MIDDEMPTELGRRRPWPARAGAIQLRATQRQESAAGPGRVLIDGADTRPSPPRLPGFESVDSPMFIHRDI